MSAEHNRPRALTIRTGLMLGSILIVAAALRIWGAFHDLPYIFHPDEPANLEVAQAMVANGDPNPHRFNYPSLLHDIDAAAGWIYFRLPALLTGRPLGFDPPLSIAMGATIAPTPSAVVLLRSIAISAGVLCVVIACLIGLVEGGPFLGLAAAAAIAISPPLVANSRYIAPDILVVFGVLLTIYTSLRIVQLGRSKDYVLAGFAVAIAAAAKYNGAIAFVCAAAAHGLRFGFGRAGLGKLFLAAATSVLAFVVLVPFSVLDSSAFVAGISSMGGLYSARHDGMDGSPVSWYLQHLWLSCGLALPMAAAEIVRAIRARSRLGIVVGSFAVAYFIFICSFNVRNERTLLPLTACVMLLAASMFVVAASYAKGRFARPVFLQALIFVLGLGLLLTPLRVTIEEGIAQSRVDSRTTAREWINAELPAGALIAVESYAPFADPARFRITQAERAIDRTPDWYRAHEVDYLVLSEGTFGRYFSDPTRYPGEIGRYRTLINAFEILRDFHDGGFEVIVLRTRRQGAPDRGVVRP